MTIKKQKSARHLNRNEIFKHQKGLSIVAPNHPWACVGFVFLTYQGKQSVWEPSKNQKDLRAHRAQHILVQPTFYTLH